MWAKIAFNFSSSPIERLDCVKTALPTKITASTHHREQWYPNAIQYLQKGFTCFVASPTVTVTSLPNTGLHNMLAQYQ